jgi:hypothetical protein
MLIKSNLDKIEKSSQFLTDSIKNKKYNDLLYSLYNILYIILDTSDSFGYNLDLKLNQNNIYTLILKYNLDLLPYIDIYNDTHSTRKRFDTVFNVDIQLLYTMHLDYVKEVQTLISVMQTFQHDYDLIIEKLVILHDFCYLFAYLFGFNIDILFDLIYQSNLSKLADTEDIAQKSIQKYQNIGCNAKYRKVILPGIHYGKFIIYNNNTGDILESINYKPFDLDNVINNSVNVLVELKLDENKISPLLSPSYLELNESEKKFIHHMTDTFNFSYDVRVYQKSHIALMMKKLLTHIFLSLRFNFEFIIEDIQSWDYFIIYFYTFIISHGFYNYSNSLKIKPKFTKAYWYKLIKHPTLNLLSFDGWIISILDRYLFSDRYRNNNITSNNLYLGITHTEAEQYYKNKEFLYKNIKPELLIGINTRLVKNVSNIIFEEPYITYCYSAINKIVDSLTKIKNLDYLKNNPCDLEMIDKLILHFTDKSIDKSLKSYNDYLIGYFSRKPKINWLLGFLDFKNDPNHRKGYLTGFMYLSEKQELLFIIDKFDNNTSLIPPKAEYIKQSYSENSLKFTNYNDNFMINPIFLTDSLNKTRKINPSFNSYILHIINNYYTINSLPFINSNTSL